MHSCYYKWCILLTLYESLFGPILWKHNAKTVFLLFWHLAEDKGCNFAKKTNKTIGFYDVSLLNINLYFHGHPYRWRPLFSLKLFYVSICVIRSLYFMNAIKYEWLWIKSIYSFSSNFLLFFVKCYDAL